jgi:hypothetical protein
MIEQWANEIIQHMQDANTLLNEILAACLSHIFIDSEDNAALAAELFIDCDECVVLFEQAKNLALLIIGESPGSPIEDDAATITTFCDGAVLGLNDTIQPALEAIIG